MPLGHGRRGHARLRPASPLSSGRSSRVRRGHRSLPCNCLWNTLDPTGPVTEYACCKVSPTRYIKKLRGRLHSRKPPSYGKPAGPTSGTVGSAVSACFPMEVGVVSGRRPVQVILILADSPRDADRIRRAVAGTVRVVETPSELTADQDPADCIIVGCRKRFLREKISLLMEIRRRLPWVPLILVTDREAHSARLLAGVRLAGPGLVRRPAPAAAPDRSRSRHDRTRTSGRDDPAILGACGAASGPRLRPPSGRRQAGSDRAGTRHGRREFSGHALTRVQHAR